jgi:hypothetical protein
LAKGDFIFLADQDDIWHPKRVTNMLEEMQHADNLLLSTAFDFFGDALTKECSRNFKFLKVNDSNKNLKNIFDIFLGRASYFGCAMVFRKSFSSIIVPIPKYVQSHDLWMAKAANLCGKNGHSKIVSLSRRMHGGNLSVVSNSFASKFYARVVFSLSLIHLLWRLAILQVVRKNESV